MDKDKIHIVAFDVPYPANYGGVIDVFYRIKTLAEYGFEIYLHCFEYGRGEAAELEKFCKKVYYYPRKKRIFDFFSSIPFIVKSRINTDLETNLLQIEAPILFEGLHTSWYLSNMQIQKRLTFVRTHNIEHEYYLGLATNASFLKRIYFTQEAKKLQKFEKQLNKASHLLCIKRSEVAHFKRFNANTHVLHPSFDIKEMNWCETEKTILFHGNLSVLENENAVLWLAENVFSHLQNVQIVVAGKSPTPYLKEHLNLKNITLIDSPSEIELNFLIAKAGVHVLYSNQSSGIKLKLLHALQTCGTVIANSEILEDSGLEHLCVHANDSKSYVNGIKKALESPLTQVEFERRKLFFEQSYNLEKNNLPLIKLLQLIR